MRVLRFTTLLLVAASLGAQETQRPDFLFTTDRAFSAASIPRYRGNHQDIYAHIDANLDSHLRNLQRWVRQPSVSAQNVGIRQMAEMLRDDLSALGFKEAELAPTSGHPGVWGFYDAGAKKTLVVYMMYDVQPVETADWQTPPFAGSVIDHDLGQVLMARGATNQKGPQRAFLNALDSIRKVKGNLPVNLMVVAEGEEELGSPHYPEVIDRYQARLKKGHGVLFPFNGQNAAGDVTLNLGVKGILYFEMESVGGDWGGPTKAEIHGSLKAITDAPVLRLTQALSTLTTADGNTITVPGYYDPIRPPTIEEQELYNGMMGNWESQQSLMRRTLGVNQWIDGMSGRPALLRYLHDTTLNVDGIWGGYTGEGVKTILPHKATAKVDSRLVPNQTPDQALDLIRKHLDARGFPDIRIRKLSGYPPAQSSVKAPLIQAAIGVYNKHGLRPDVAPRLAGSAPYYVFTERLGLPMIAGGLGHGSGAHAPNEYMVVNPKPGSRVAGLAQVEKFYVDLIYALAAAP